MVWENLPPERTSYTAANTVIKRAVETTGEKPRAPPPTQPGITEELGTLLPLSFR